MPSFSSWWSWWWFVLPAIALALIRKGWCGRRTIRHHLYNEYERGTLWDVYSDWSLRSGVKGRWSWSFRPLHVEYRVSLVEIQRGPSYPLATVPPTEDTQRVEREVAEATALWRLGMGELCLAAVEELCDRDEFPVRRHTYLVIEGRTALWLQASPSDHRLPDVSYDVSCR